MSEREWEDEKKLMTYALVFDGWQIITHFHNDISKQIKSKLKINCLGVKNETLENMGHLVTYIGLQKKIVWYISTLPRLLKSIWWKQYILLFGSSVNYHAFLTTIPNHLPRAIHHKIQYSQASFSALWLLF